MFLSLYGNYWKTPRRRGERWQPCRCRLSQTAGISSNSQMAPRDFVSLQTGTILLTDTARALGNARGQPRIIGRCLLRLALHSSRPTPPFLSRPSRRPHPSSTPHRSSTLACTVLMCTRAPRHKSPCAHHSPRIHSRPHMHKSLFTHHNRPFTHSSLLIHSPFTHNSPPTSLLCPAPARRSSHGGHR